MIVNDFEQPPTIFDGQFISAADVNLWARNCAYLDQMAYRREPVFDSLDRLSGPSSALHHNMPGTTGYLLWRGGLVFRSHYTTLTVLYRRIGTIAAGARLRIFVNNVMLAEFVPASGDGSQAVVIANRGYVDGQPIVIEVKINGLSSTDLTSEWWVTYVYATPAYVSPTLSDPSLPVIGGAPPITSASGGRAWIPLPTFAGVYTQTALNSISNNQLHLFDRMNQVPLTGNRSYLSVIVSHRLGDFETWTGSATRRSSVEVYRLAGDLTLLSAGSDTIRVYMNDVLQTTIGPYTTVGTHTFSVAVPFPSAVVPQRVRIKLVYNSTVQRDISVPSRLNIRIHRSEPASGSYPALTLPGVLGAGGHITATGLNGALNQIVALLNAIKTRVDNSSAFTVVRAYRDNFGYDDHGRRSNDRAFPYTFQRRGSRLFVYGKNVQLGFGGQVFELDEDNHTTYKYKFANEQNIIPGDKYDVKTIYLDSIKGLFPGDVYFLVGDVSVAMEYVK